MEHRIGKFTLEVRGDTIVLRLADKPAVEVVIQLKDLERWIARKMRDGVFA